MSGEPTYIELGVDDPDRARTFFSGLLGWDPSGESGSGAVETATLGIGIHGGDPANHFEVFFAVTDLDSSLGRLDSLGGKTVSEINDSPGFGRWVECVDDQGTRFGLRQPA